jgi:hypothetical protein
VTAADAVGRRHGARRTRRRYNVSVTFVLAASGLAIPAVVVVASVVLLVILLRGA